MVKLLQWAARIGCAAFFVACGTSRDLPDQEVGGFSVPWAAAYDADADAYFVSDVDGDPLAKDGKAAIWRMRPDGTQLTAWARGGVAGVELHAPKGIALQGDLLYCCDLDVVRTFDRATGAAVRVIEVPLAKALDGAAAGPGGEVWVTNTATNSIHAIAKDGSVRRIAQHADLKQPSALVVLATGAYVVTRGSGEFLQVDGKGRCTPLMATPSRSLDGLVRPQEGRWLCASRSGNAIYALDTKGGMQPLAWPSLQSPGAMGLDFLRGRLLVPSQSTGKLLVRRI